ncbi:MULTISPECIES: Imm10 family immunity protein [unclassified Streptomyces]|uniref:Imm10 family immunity protein n=1 Tax=unclassified Streptomyces TaxID=2593676 RepID=UPI00380DEA69
MSRLDWQVKVVTAEENIPDSCFIVGLAGDQYGDTGHFIFQAALSEPDEQSRRLGLDSYCVLNEAGGVHFGGIEKVSLAGRRISFTFDPEAVEELELPASEIELDIAPDVDMERLRYGLRRVLNYGNQQKIPEISGI